MTEAKLNTKFITKSCRLSYLSLLNPRKTDDGKEAYQCTVLIPKTDKDSVAKIKELIENAKKKDAGKLATGSGAIKSPLLDGDKKDEEGAFHYKDENVRGHYFLRTASTTRKPEIVDLQLEPIISPSEVYSGMWGQVSINFYGWASKTGRGIAAGLGNVRKTKDDESFAGGARAADEFSAVDDDFLS